MNESRSRMDDPTDEEIAKRLTDSLFSEADTAENADGQAPEYENDVRDADEAADYVVPGPADDGAFIPETDARPDPRQIRHVEKPRVEAFVPTDAFYNDTPRRKRKKHHRTKRNYAWIALIVLGVALLAAGGLYLFNVRNNPGTFFGGANMQIETEKTPVPTAASVQTVISAAETPAPTPTPTLDPYAALVAQADTSMMQNIVNILVIGVDYAEERETWSGKKEWHSDVMMLLAINFDEKRADLISLPRDTYANIPGIKGIYKLNAAINCGGGMDAPGGAGFLKVCEAASWMLGGIPVNYYYAVTMPAVKGLVDAVGGVDYELETSFTMMGRHYNKGMRHLDGQGVLDYLRVRKSIAQSGDVNRVNRQKKMMVALFETMQQQNLILKIPDIVSSFDGQLFTNCTLSQTAALASFAYNLDKENIGMYSMGSKGGGNTNIFNWNFCLTDQPNRVKIIKTVYGIDVPQEREYTPQYAKYRWADMRADRYLSNANKVLDYAADYIAHGELFSDATIPFLPDGFVDPSYPADLAPSTDPVFPDDFGEAGGIPDGALGMNALNVARYGFRLRAVTLGQTYSQMDLDAYNSLRQQVGDFEDTRARAAREAEKYRNGQENSFSEASGALISAMDSLQSNATLLAESFGYGSLSWGLRYEKDKSFNEVTVDFN